MNRHLIGRQARQDIPDNQHFYKIQRNMEKKKQGNLRNTKSLISLNRDNSVEKNM